MAFCNFQIVEAIIFIYYHCRGHQVMDLYKLWALDVQFPHSFSLCMLIIPKGKLLVRVASNFEI